MKRLLLFSHIQRARKTEKVEAKRIREVSIDRRSSNKCLVNLKSMYGILRNRFGGFTFENTVHHMYFHVISHQ